MCGNMETLSYHSMVNIDIDLLILIKHENNHLYMYIQVNSGASLASIWTVRMLWAGTTLRTLSGLTPTLSSS